MAGECREERLSPVGHITTTPGGGRAGAGDGKVVLVVVVGVGAGVAKCVPVDMTHSDDTSSWLMNVETNTNLKCKTKKCENYCFRLSERFKHNSEPPNMTLNK